MSNASRRSATRLHRNQSGSAVIEFALVLPLTLLLVFGVLDFGKAFNYWIDETHLANTGARWAVVDKNPGEPDGLTLQEYVKSLGDTSELRGAMSVCVSFPGGSSSVGDPVRMTVSYPYDWMPFLDSQLGITSKTITSTATMRLERPPSAYEEGCA